MTSEQETPQRYREVLQRFMDLFDEYAKEVLGDHRREYLDETRRQLQRLEPEVTLVLSEVLGEGALDLGLLGRVSRRDLLSTALMGGNNEMAHNFGGFNAAVTSSLERAIGRLEAGMWSESDTEPVLLIHDTELMDRCSDLLAAPGNYDRVIREATLVLEDRIRRKVPQEVLSRLIPVSAEQIGEHLVNRVFSPDNPVLVTSSERVRLIALHRILLGVVSYLRNPSHHQLDPNLEWSWAWSTVGLVDRLLFDIEACALSPQIE